MKKLILTLCLIGGNAFPCMNTVALLCKKMNESKRLACIPDVTFLHIGAPMGKMNTDENLIIDEMRRAVASCRQTNLFVSLLDTGNGKVVQSCWYNPRTQDTACDREEVKPDGSKNWTLVQAKLREMVAAK